MPYRVVQWSTGNLGRAAIEGIVAHPELELAGVWVHSADKEGRDAGELAGIGPVGVRATRSLDEILALEPDCILYSPLLPTEAEMVRMLESGIDVVTPLGWFYPKHLSVDALEDACRRGGATLHGTGIHPGGMTERLPLVLSAFCQQITSVRVDEFSDCRTYGAPDVLRDIMMFGKPPDEAKAGFMLRFLSTGFFQSIDMIADTLGFPLDAEKQARHDVWAATAPIESPIGTIEPGQLAAQRFTWQGCVRGEPVITARVNWFMGRDHIEDGWDIGDAPERYEIEVVGDPPITMELHGIHPDGSTSIARLLERNPGMVATANHCVSAIPYVCRAEAGIRTYLDLPLVAGRAKIDGPSG
jgi:2,4-diaminopentanoate dehydrogenase